MLVGYREITERKAGKSDKGKEIGTTYISQLDSIANVVFKVKREIMWP